MAKRVIEEIEAKFEDAIRKVKNLIGVYDCENLLNSKTLSKLIKEMDTLFDKMKSNERLVNGNSNHNKKPSVCSTNGNQLDEYL